MNFEPLSRYCAYMPNSTYYNAANYIRELKRLRSRELFQIYGEPNQKMFEAAMQIGYLILEHNSEDVNRGSNYKSYMLLKKRDAKLYLADQEKEEEEKQKKKKPLVFNTKDLWSSQSQAA